MQNITRDAQGRFVQGTTGLCFDSQVSATQTNTPSRSQTLSQPPSVTQTASHSQTQSDTASFSQTQTITRSASQTATSTVSCTSSVTQSASLTASPSASGSSIFPTPPLLWFDATVLAAAGQTTGSRVALWSDSSGNHHDASQGSPSLRPVFYANGLGPGLPGVYFDGATNILAGGPLAWSTPCSMVAVLLQDCAPPTTPECSGVFGFWDTSDSYISLSTAASGGNNTLVWADFSYGLGTSAGANLNGVQYIATVTYDGTSSRGYVNGCLSDSGPVVTMLGSTGFYIGSRNSLPGHYFNGFISELLYFATPLSTAQQSHLEARLAAKWAQPSSSSCWAWSNASATVQGAYPCSASQFASTTASQTSTVILAVTSSQSCSASGTVSQSQSSTSSAALDPGSYSTSGSQVWYGGSGD